MPSENQQVLRLRLDYLMLRFLLLALGMGFLLPTAVSAESYWLIITQGTNSGDSMIPIQMINMVQCETQGQRFISSDRLGNNRKARGYECLKGI